MYCVYVISGNARIAWKVFRTLKGAQAEQKKLSRSYRFSVIESIVEKA